MKFADPKNDIAFKKPLEELSGVKEKWIYFVKNAGDMTLIPKEMEYPREIREAFEVANQLSWTKEELDAYDKKGIYIQDERGRVEYAREEGIEAGERSKALKVAKELLNSGVSIDIILKAAGFFVDIFYRFFRKRLVRFFNVLFCRSVAGQTRAWVKICQGPEP